MAKDGSGIWKRGDSWYVELYVGGQRYRESLGKVSRTFAKEMAAKRRTELLEGTLRPKAEDPRFDKFLDKYLRDVSINKAPNTHRSEKTSSVHLKAFFGRMRLSQISRIHIERYKRDRKAAIIARTGNPRASLASINRELALMSHAFNVANFSNPVSRAKRFEEFGRERFLEADEEQRLFRAVEEVDANLEPLFRILINAGYRVGEVLSLTNDKEMINFKEGYIKIPRMIRKTKKRDVVTPLNNTLTDAVKRAIRISGAERGKGERIFPYALRTIEKKWGKIREKAGLEEGFRLHDLRHTFGSRAAQMAHDDPYAVQDLMGHTDFRTTQKYIHVSQSRKKTVMDRMDHNTPIFTPMQDSRAREEEAN